MILLAFLGVRAARRRLITPKVIIELAAIPLKRVKGVGGKSGVLSRRAVACFSRGVVFRGSGEKAKFVGETEACSARVLFQGDQGSERRVSGAKGGG